MNYLQALKTARDHFGMDATAIRGQELIPVSELIEKAETAPIASGEAQMEVSLQTGGELTTGTGKQIRAWAITEVPQDSTLGAMEEGSREGTLAASHESEPLLLVVSGGDLQG